MKRILSSLLIAILVMVQLTPNIPLVYAQAARGEEVTYSVDKAYDADSKTTSITVKAQPGFDAITVDSITTPEGELISGSEVTYAATANGSYLFTIAYTSQTENDEETITSGSAVTVGSDVNVDHKTLDVMVEVTDFTEKKELLAGEGVEINSDNFPDPVFMEYVRQFDTGTKDGVLDQDELDKVEVVSGGNNNSLEFGSVVGIQYFTKLKELLISSINMTELNVSYNTELEELYIYDTPIKTLDLTKNVALKKLTIYNLNDDGKLRTLDLSENKNLTDLKLQHTKLTELDLSNNPKIVEVDVFANQLKKLDVSGITALETLNCSRNRLKELNLEGNSNLITVDASENQLKLINLKNNKKLKTLSLYNNQVSELDLSENTVLEDVNLDSNQLMKLDVSHLENLSSFSCGKNQLTFLDLSKNVSLTNLMLELQQVHNNNIWVKNDNGYEFDMKKLVGQENLDHILSVDNEDGSVDYNNNTGIITAKEKFDFIYQYDTQVVDSLSDNKMDVFVGYKLYSMNAIAEGNGSISPSGVTWLEEGMDQEYTITPDDGYRLDQLIVNGSEVEPVQSYTIKDIRSHQTIEAVFKSEEEDETPPEVEHYIFAKVQQLPGGPDSVAYYYGGTISSPGVTAMADGVNWEYVMTPDDGMKLAYVLVDGKRIEEIKNNSYLFENVTQNHTIEAVFEPIKLVGQYYIEAKAGENGTISPNGSTMVNEGTNREYTITPDDEYIIDKLIVDGKVMDAQYYYTFFAVSQNHKIEVTFKKIGGIVEQDAVPIDEKHFSDPDFRRYVRQFDTIRVNGILEKDEIDAVNEMQVILWVTPVGKNCNLDGIGVFTELKKLSFSTPESDDGRQHFGNIQMDLSQNTKLEKLDLAKEFWFGFNLENNVNIKELCGVKVVSDLDLSVNRALEKLTCFSQNLSTINLIQNDKLKYLTIEGQGAKLTELDLSQNADLKELTIINTKLTELDLRNNTALEKINLSENASLKTLNIDNITQLQELICEGNSQLADLDLSTNTYLKKLVIYQTPNNTIDVSNNLELEELKCVRGNSKVILGKNKKLKELTVSSMNLDSTSLNLEECTGLEVLNLGYGASKIVDVDVSGMPNLKKLVCAGTQIKKLDVTKNEKLEYLNCSDTKIRTLNLLNNKKLTYLEASRTNLKELDLKANTLLETLIVESADLSILDVSNCLKLENIVCGQNKITSLDVRNSTNLKVLFCDQNQLTKLDVSKNNNLRSINCFENQLTNLELTNKVGLHYLNSNPQKISRNKIWAKKVKTYEFNLGDIVGKENLKYVTGVINDLGEKLEFDNNSGIIESLEECEFSYMYDFQFKNLSLGTEFMEVSVRLPGAYSIYASADSNGSISPEGETRLKEGLNQSYTIKPHKGYEIDQLLIDGKAITPVLSYTFKDIDEDHKIDVTFKKTEEETPTPPGGGGGDGGGGDGGGTVTPPVTPPVDPPVTPPVNPPVDPPVTPPVNPDGGGTDNGGETITPPVTPPTGGGGNGSGTVTPPTGNNNTETITAGNNNGNTRTNTIAPIERPNNQAVGKANRTAPTTKLQKPQKEELSQKDLDILDDSNKDGTGNTQHPGFGANDQICILHILILLAALILTIYMLIKRKKDKEDDDDEEEIIQKGYRKA